MNYAINNHTSYDLEQLDQLAREFLPFAQKRMGFEKPPVINFVSDEENSLNPLGKTGHYSPSEMSITIMVDKRHIKDILRSLSHELVHHNQNCRGDFNREFSTQVGYAQDDEFLRGLEDEAYREGNFCLRDWEDGIKRSKIKNKQLNETIYKRTFSRGEESMSTKDWKNQELNKNLMERWGYKLTKKEQINEDSVYGRMGDEELKEMCKAGDSSACAEQERRKSLTEEVEQTSYLDTSKGGDYLTGEKTFPYKETEEDESEDVTSEETNPLSVEQRKTNNKPVEESKKKKDLNEHTSYSEKLLKERLDNKDPFLLYKNWITEPSDSLHKTTKSKKSLLKEGAKKKVMDVLDWLSGGRVRAWASDAGKPIAEAVLQVAQGKVPEKLSSAIGDSLRTTFAKVFNTNELLDDFLKKVSPPEVKPGVLPEPVVGAFKEGEDAIVFLNKNENGKLFDNYIDALKNTEGLDESFKLALDSNPTVRKNLADMLIAESKSLSSLRDMTKDLLEKWVDGILEMAAKGNVKMVKAVDTLDEAVAVAVEVGTKEGKEAAEILADAKKAIIKTIEDSSDLAHVKKGLENRAGGALDPGDMEDFAEGFLTKSEKAAKTIESVKAAARPAGEAAGAAARAGAELTTETSKAVADGVDKIVKAHFADDVPGAVDKAMADAFRSTGAGGAGGALMPGTKKSITDAIELQIKNSDEYADVLKNIDEQIKNSPGYKRALEESDEAAAKFLKEQGDEAAERLLKESADKIYKTELGFWNKAKRLCGGKAGMSNMGFQAAFAALPGGGKWYQRTFRGIASSRAGGIAKGLGKGGQAVLCAWLGYKAIAGTVGAVTGSEEEGEGEAKQRGGEQAKTGHEAKTDDQLAEEKEEVEKIIDELEPKEKDGTITEPEQEKLDKARGKRGSINEQQKRNRAAKSQESETLEDTPSGGIPVPGGDKPGGAPSGECKGTKWGCSPKGLPFPGPHDWDRLGSMAVVRKLKELGYHYDKTQTAGGWWKKLPRMHPARVAYRNYWKSLKRRYPHLGRKKRKKPRVVGYDTKRAMDVYAGGEDPSGRPHGTHKQYYEGTPAVGKRPSAKNWPKTRPWPPPNQAVAKQAYDQGLDIRGTKEGDKFLKDVDY